MKYQLSMYVMDVYVIYVYVYVNTADTNFGRAALATGM